ncbi:aromatic-ring-hydroxylating dioxygenase subunit beta [Pseudonocardia pini]|uniref:aromatic-ring-hydroxylating dioxygenase subunit beta n=1 Tax=Pseudonocardia pini TaxID=2758030 RepID=UPI001C68D407|nr:aromatic-ring-hydroxylating dioxygenase subunit beta [Pseudonocardia pini]
MNLDEILGSATTSSYVDDAYYALLQTDLTEWRARGTPLADPDLEGLILHENWLLDRRAYEDWFDLYARECLYWVPNVDVLAEEPPTLGGKPTGGSLGYTKAAVRPHDPRTRVAIAFDDRRRLGDRIVWLRTGVAYSQLPPSATSHVSSGFVRVPTARPGEVKIRSQFVCHEIRAGHPVRTLAGWAGHVLVTEDGETRIARKIAALLDPDRTHLNLSFLL